VHWLGLSKVIYYLIGRSKILLLVQFDSTGENVKQILIAREIEVQWRNRTAAHAKRMMAGHFSAIRRPCLRGSAAAAK
jgi:hypothetical protein